MGRRRLPHGDPPDGQVLRLDRRRGADHQLRQRLTGSGVVPDPGQGGARPVPRRVRVPASDELFRPTVVPAPDADPGADPGADRGPEPGVVAELAVVDPRPAATPRTGSGRVRHEEKMTVYVT